MKNMICSACKSENVLKDAYAVWSKEEQKWDICTLFDHAICEECGGETNIEEIDLKTGEKS